MAHHSNSGAQTQADRVALITGASRGLGYTVAEFLARQRWTLILTARHEVPLLEAVKRLQATGASISAVPGDVTQDRHRRDLGGAVRRIGRRLARPAAVMTNVSLFNGFTRFGVPLKIVSGRGGRALGAGGGIHRRATRRAVHIRVGAATGAARPRSSS